MIIELMNNTKKAVMGADDVCEDKGLINIIVTFHATTRY